MNFTWKPGSLPTEPWLLGHGVGIVKAHQADDEPTLVAFVDGFGWRQGKGDILVRYDTVRFPTGEAGEKLRQLLEEILLQGVVPYPSEIAPTYRLHVNG